MFNFFALFQYKYLALYQSEQHTHTPRSLTFNFFIWLHAPSNQTTAPFLSFSVAVCGLFSIFCYCCLSLIIQCVYVSVWFRQESVLVRLPPASQWWKQTKFCIWMRCERKPKNQHCDWNHINNRLIHSYSLAHTHTHTPSTETKEQLINQMLATIYLKWEKLKFQCIPCHSSNNAITSISSNTYELSPLLFLSFRNAIPFCRCTHTHNQSSATISNYLFVFDQAHTCPWLNH